MSELDRLISRCEGEVSLTINGFLSDYLTVEKWAADAVGKDGESRFASADEIAACVNAGRVVVLHFYPRTPISFFRIIKPSVDEAVAAGHAALDEKSAQPEAHP